MYEWTWGGSGVDRLQIVLKPNASSVGRPGQGMEDDFEKFLQQKNVHRHLWGFSRPKCCALCRESYL
ncbi:MAG TPA: hypothetical protein DDX19_11270 [Rhodopirellula baltica]|nr:hypothetical protein [Rhodopirellula baltica]